MLHGYQIQPDKRKIRFIVTKFKFLVNKQYATSKLKYLNILPYQILLSSKDLLPILVCHIHLITSDDPQIVLNFFLWGSFAFPEAGYTWTRGLSAPTGLVANDLRHVAFLVCFKVDGECNAAPVGGGGELGGVAIFL